MRNYNKVILMGHLSKDPIKKLYKGNSKSYTFVSIATNRRFKDSSGIEKSEATFVGCKAYGKLGDIIFSNFKKGRPIFVEGSLKLEKWTDKDTNKKMERLVIIIDSFEFLDSKKEVNQNQSGDNGNEDFSDENYDDGSSSDEESAEGFDELVKEALNTND